mmetsp:Transcript_22539/g.49142  ORF Transcript_22539/g.49142 Transcript_22539/m.49142 type:complete len:93 (-) Transcript_22539:574-852(-)
MSRMQKAALDSSSDSTNQITSRSRVTLRGRRLRHGFGQQSVTDNRREDLGKQGVVEFIIDSIAALEDSLHYADTIVNIFNLGKEVVDMTTVT